jgi:uncharacterized protein with von Willebrand factor type A (vWA) domain
VWRENRRRDATSVSTWDLLRGYGPDYKLILVGDATMSPYEVIQPGGSVEHWNEEAGQVWIGRLASHFRCTAWLNPTREDYWRHTQSIVMLQDLLAGRMFPMTLAGLDDMTRELSR